MTYKQLKWFILLIPTVTVGLWEYVRHEYLLPYISMDLGNWLTPFIVLFVTLTLLTRFFTKLERMQEQLRIERAEKAVLEERERIAHDLHDGMAQSLFLLSVKVKQLEKLDVSEADKPKLASLNKSIIDIHNYVRSGLENLRNPPSNHDLLCEELLNKHIKKLENESNIEVKTLYEVNDGEISSKEKTELAACIGESLVNVQKHAKATKVIIDIKITDKDRYIIIKDDGIGFDLEKVLKEDHYGIKMMQERCAKINWQLKIERKEAMTMLTFTPNKGV